MGGAAWAMLLALSILWGGSFFFMDIIVREMPPLSVAAARLFSAAIVLQIVLWAGGMRLQLRGGMWRAFLAMGLINNAIPFSLLAWGQTHIAGGLAAILNSTMLIFSVIVAHFFTDNEKITPARIFGVAAGFCGIVVMIGTGVLSGLGNKVLAQFAVLGATFCYACATVYGLRFRRRGIPPLSAATGQITAAAIILLPFALIIDAPWTFAADISPPAAASLLLLGVVSTGLAYLLYFRILSSSGATNVALVTFLVPITPIILGSLFLGETFRREHFIGMFLIGIGLAAIDGRILRMWQRIKAK